MAVDMISQDNRQFLEVPVRSAAIDAECQRGSMPDTMARLRYATLPAHERIERNPRLSALLRPGLSELHYQDVLRRYFAYFSGVEPSLFLTLSSIVPTSELDRRRKIPLLQGDLEGCGITAQIVEPSPSRRWTYVQALGRLYVHEGATLGGRMIHAALRQSIGQTRPSAFFAGYGAETAEVWRRTKEILRAGITSEAEISEAAEAANAAFREIEAIMA